MRIKNIWLSTETVDTAKKIDANTSTETIKSLFFRWVLGKNLEHFTDISRSALLNNDILYVLKIFEALLVFRAYTFTTC